MSTDSEPPVEEMSRTELEDEVRDLRGVHERIDELEQRLDEQAAVQFRGDDSYLENLWVGTHPVGRMVEKATDRSRDAIDKAEGGDDGAGVSTAVRSAALDVHVHWMDVKDGRGENLKANRQRAAVLFSRFIKRACGEANVGVEPESHGRYRMQGERAKQILQASEHVTMPASGVSKTVRRAMTFVQEGTRREDCDCTDMESCGHGLVVFKRDDGYALTADAEAFREYLRGVESAVEGEIEATDDATAADGSRGSGNTTHEVDEEFEQLASATPEKDSADTVVSSESDRPSAPANHRSGKTSTSR